MNAVRLPSPSPIHLAWISTNLEKRQPVLLNTFNKISKQTYPFEESSGTNINKMHCLNFFLSAFEISKASICEKGDRFSAFKKKIMWRSTRERKCININLLFFNSCDKWPIWFWLCTAGIWRNSHERASPRPILPNLYGSPKMLDMTN